MSDAAQREAERTEIHPDRDTTVMPEGVRKQTYVPIRSDPGVEITVDVITPEERPATLRPAMVWLHGGSWMGGSSSQFHYLAGQLAKRFGIFNVSVDYRLSKAAPFPAALHDCKAAIRWVRSIAEAEHIDPTRIGVGGGSAGGHLSSLIHTTAGWMDLEGDGDYQAYSSATACAVLFNGEFDMWDLVKNQSLITDMRQFFGGEPDAVPEIYDLCTTINHIRPHLGPVLLLHGNQDICVSHTQSLDFFNAMRRAGNHAEIEIYDGKEHAWFNFGEDRKVTSERVARFLETHL